LNWNVLQNVTRLREENPEPHFAVVDFDGTVIGPADCAETVLAYMAMHNLLGHPEKDFKAYYQLIDSCRIRDAYRMLPALLRGYSIEEIRAITRKAVIEEGATPGERLFLDRTISCGIAPRREVVSLVDELRKQKISTWIVSASPELIVHATMEYFNIEVDGVIGIQSVIRDGRLTTELVEPLPIYEGKVECIKKFIHPSMGYTFARVGAVIQMKVEDYYIQKRRGWVRLHEKGGKVNELPCHHNLEQLLDEWLTKSGLSGEPTAPLFPTMRHGKLTGRQSMAQAEVYKMIRRRAIAAGIGTKISCHSFRATGITTYLQNGGKLEVAQQMAGHESARTTGLYDRRNDAVALDEVERITY
jgi:phosphoserine phosphatase